MDGISVEPKKQRAAARESRRPQIVPMTELFQIAPARS